MIKLKTEKEIGIMREAGKITASIMVEVLSNVKPGVRSVDIDKNIELLCRRNKVKPAFKDYNEYKFSTCICINEGVVHCLPSKRVLVDGDILSLDFGIIYKGYYSDHARTIGVGDISLREKKLIQTNEMCLSESIKKCQPGNCIGDISHVIHKTAILGGFGTIDMFGGHGIGASLHEDPFIPNFGFKGEGGIIVEGMVLAIEPIVCEAKCEYKELDDGWTVVTYNPPTLVSHMEDVVAVTENGPEVLTRI
jgi:methionyl aminopeptidase